MISPFLREQNHNGDNISISIQSYYFFKKAVRDIPLNLRLLDKSKRYQSSIQREEALPIIK